MSVFTKRVIEIEHTYNTNEQIKIKIEYMYDELSNLNNHYAVMLEAQQLLTTVSDDNTRSVLDYITSIINKTLSEIFPHDSRRIFIEKKMFQGQHAHINIRLTGTAGVKRDLNLQSGTGLRQVISFLFVVCLIELRKGRRILIADELLSGMHPVAKNIVKEIIHIFADTGFQFMFVEYGIDDLGKVYLVEKPSDSAIVSQLGKAYENEVFVFNRPPEEVDLTLSVDEGYD